MRVIAGTHRSRILKQVEHITTRETKDRVKESIFNSISNYIPDSLILDLFSGSGSLGIEALSRGAKQAVLNDYDNEAFKVLEKNVNTLQLQGKTSLSKEDYLTCLLSQSNAFDVILLDPPYKLEVLDIIIRHIEERKLLDPSGIIVILSNKERIIEDTDLLEVTKEKNMGITKVTYMKWRG